MVSARLRQTLWGGNCAALAPILVGLSLCGGLALRPAEAAEQVILGYGAFEMQVTVADVETFAQTGRLEGSLSLLAPLAPPNRQAQIQSLLTRRLPLSPDAMARFLRSDAGQLLLQQSTDFVQPGTRQPDPQPLAIALERAAHQPAPGLSLLGLLKAFPNSVVYIDAARSLALLEQAHQMAEETRQAVDWMQQMAQTKAQQFAPPQQPWRDPTLSWRVINLRLRASGATAPAEAALYLPPVSAGRVPLVVLSHGIGEDYTSLTYLAEYLAQGGFGVLAFSHPRLPSSDSATAPRLLPQAFVRRPLDIRAALDDLQRLSRRQRLLRNRLDLQRVGVIGQSFGGYTALVLGGAQPHKALLREECGTPTALLNLSLNLLQCRLLQLPHIPAQLADPRVKAVIALQPVAGAVFGPAGLAPVRVPVLLVAASRDWVTPALPEQIEPFTELTIPQRYLAVLVGATHFSGRTERQPNPFPSEWMGPDPDLARSHLQRLSLAFMDTHLAGRERLRSWLSPAGVA
ncbi:MAG: alpha/beta hydrolase, partial [Gloeomargaritaceae cyanobacterium C42_A2020_066]|nr:alpha/beta hydrolase [Gloeomargaritaceae cyanobacterium C42_A2020_066]